MKTLWPTFLFVLLILLASFSALSNEPIVVVVNAKASVQKVEKRELINLYMGKYAAFANGERALAIDVAGDDKLKEAFYGQLVGLSLGRVNAYWSRIKFTGSARPPMQIEGLKDIQQEIKTNTAAVAYLYKSQVNEDMKVVYQFD